MNRSYILSFLVLGALLASGIAGAGYFVGQTLYNAKIGINVAEAKGLAERRVKSDRADWTIGYEVVAPNNDDMSALYKRAEVNRNKIVAVLKNNGFESAEIAPGIVDYRVNEYRDNYTQKVIEQKHVLSGNIDVETTKVDKLTAARAAVNELLAQGIIIQNNSPAYKFTKLNEVKPEMLSEAAKNARIAANEFASNAGVSVGKIRNARQGGFIIRDAGAEYGDTAKLFKDVRVVTTVSFYLAD